MPSFISPNIGSGMLQLFLRTTSGADEWISEETECSPKSFPKESSHRKHRLSTDFPYTNDNSRNSSTTAIAGTIRTRSVSGA